MGPLSTAALISGGASVIGGIISGKGQSKANKANLKIARENREWQEKMSNTAVQRRMKDLAAGGINPLLAGRYDATTPPGNIATMGNVGGAAVEGATQSGRAVSQTMKEQVEINNINAATGKTVQETKNLQVQNALINTQAENEIKKGLGLDQSIIRQKFENELIKLKIPEAQSYERFWTWVRDASIDELVVALGKVGAGAAAATVGAAISAIIALKSPSAESDTGKSVSKQAHERFKRKFKRKN